MLKASRGHWLGFMTRHADLLGLGTSSRAQGLVLQDFCPRLFAGTYRRRLLDVVSRYVVLYKI